MEAPSILIIQIKRYNNKDEKINKPLDFPLQLNIQSYLHPHYNLSSDNHLYNLFSMIVCIILYYK